MADKNITLIIMVLMVLFLIIDYRSAMDIKEILIIQSKRIDLLKYRIDELEKQLKEQINDNRI